MPQPSHEENLTKVSTTYSVLPLSDVTIIGTTTSGGFTITLPAVSAVPIGRSFVFMNDGSANTLTLAAAGSDTINGSSTNASMTTQYSKATVRGDGVSKWFLF